MKRSLQTLLAVFLCLSILFSLFPGAQGLPETDSEIPFSKETLLSALYEANIESLRQAIDLELVTCEELTAYYLERIEAYDEPYNCFITICDDALEVARQRDAQLAEGNAEGLLFGIPIVIKDNMDLEGYPTTNGHKKSQSSTADDNAYVVDRLLEEGAVIIAKTNMSTNAQDARVSLSEAVGYTNNAYNPLMASGGSSGGSAVATALNFAAASLGTDTNSSLRIPAVLNGCVSLRATFDMIPRDGIKRLNSTRDVPGAITRNIYDLAIMMDVLTENAYGYTENLDANALDGLRIGILSQLVREADKNTDPEVLAAFENAAQELHQCGAEIITVSMPNLFSLSQASLSGDDQSARDALYADYQDLLEEYDLDAVIYPSYSSTPLRCGTDKGGTYWNPWEQPFLNNCRTLSPNIGIPELSVVIGYHSLGAGIGMEIAADKDQEQLLLNIAYCYTSRYDHRITPSGAPDTYADYHAGSLTALMDIYLATNAPTAPTTPTTEPKTEDQTLTAEPDKDQEGLPLWPWLILLGLSAVIAVVLIRHRLRLARKARRRRRRRPAPSRDSHYV